MRLQNAINEGIKEDTFHLFMTNILNDCKPFISDLDMNHPKFLYSGRKRDIDWFEQNVRQDRQPKDLSKDIHKDFDDEFLRQFGWRARSTGLFCSGNESIAFEYGNTFMIFPKGPYKFVWSEKVTDLYIYVQRVAKSFVASKDGNILYQHIYQQMAKEISDADIDAVPGDTFYDDVRERYDKFIIDTVNTYSPTNLKKAMESDREIMVNCKSYYAVRYTDWHIMTYEFLKHFKGKMPPKDELIEFMR